jgi:transposase
VEYFAGLDVSLEETAICIIDDTGLIVREARTASEPEALVAFFRASGIAMKRVGLEACSLTAWLHQALTEAGIAVICIDTRQAKAAMVRCQTRPIAMTRVASRRSCVPAGTAQCM